MNIIVDIAEDIPQWPESKIVDLALFALEYNDVPDDVEVSISLVSDEEIASLNET
ncbi:MAG: hypothetical protein HGA54_10105, partial [Actinobacteria bacterium]|nr:hypothetical protein [Actinomycetota bacterium]